MQHSPPREIEVRFLDIDLPAMRQRLQALGAEDRGEHLLDEFIFYDRDGSWQQAKNRMVRLRQVNSEIFLAHKYQRAATATGTEEIEFQVDNLESATQFLENIGLRLARQQQKKRHQYFWQNVWIELDQQPLIPPYLEIEGPSETALRQTADKLGLDWEQAVFENMGIVLEKQYGLRVWEYRFYTFDRVE